MSIAYPNVTGSKYFLPFKIPSTLHSVNGLEYNPSNEFYKSVIKKHLNRSNFDRVGIVDVLGIRACQESANKQTQIQP